MVVTVEPGMYFIPALIEAWAAEGRHSQYINYDTFREYQDFGGIRIEDNVLITADGTACWARRFPRRWKKSKPRWPAESSGHAGSKPPTGGFFLMDAARARAHHLTTEPRGAMMEQVECLVIGAGVIGLAMARQLAMAGREVVIVEAESAIGQHASSRNSEVIHAGLYYPPGA